MRQQLSIVRALIVLPQLPACRSADLRNLYDITANLKFNDSMMQKAMNCNTAKVGKHRAVRGAHPQHWPHVPVVMYLTRPPSRSRTLLNTSLSQKGPQRPPDMSPAAARTM
jgi:hypothetical protein